MSETTQTTFAGLRSEGLGAKEAQDSAEVVINCDFHRQMIEPRSGREVVLGKVSTGRFPCGGIRLDGSRSWVQVVPDFNGGLTNYAATICWRFDPRIQTWAVGTQGTLMACYERLAGAPATYRLLFRVWVEMTAPGLRMYAGTQNVAWHQSAVPLDISGLGEGDVLRVIGYVYRDMPIAGSTEMGLIIYQNGANVIAAGCSTIDNFAADANAGLGTDSRWSLGADGWDELEADVAYFFQRNELSGAIADFMLWTGENDHIDDELTYDPLFPWFWDCEPEELHPHQRPYVHIPMDKASSWILDDIGTPPPGSDPALAWVHPFPVMERAVNGQIPARFTFHALDKGTTVAPPEVDVLEKHVLTIALDFRFPLWLTATAQDVSILASGDGWYLAVLQEAGGNYKLRLYLAVSSTAGGWLSVQLPAAAGTLVANTTYRCAVALDRRAAAQFAYLWLRAGGVWASPVALGIVHGDTFGINDKEINFGGFPTVGQYTKDVAIIERVAIGMSPADPSAVPAATTFDEFVDDMLSDDPRAPVCTAFIPSAGRTKYGIDDARIHAAMPLCHPVLEVNDWLGREEIIHCVPSEMVFSTSMGYLTGLHPQRVLGAASYETDEGIFRIGVLTDSAVNYWEPGILDMVSPLDGSAMNCYYDQVPVVAQAFRRRIFWFGSSGTRQKFNGDRACSIGIERPLLFELTVTKVVEDDAGPILDGGQWFKVSLYNSRNGQESNLSNAKYYLLDHRVFGLLLQMNIGYRDGDDFDEVGIWRRGADLNYHLEMRVRRSNWPGREAAGWLAYMSFGAIDNRVIVRLSPTVLDAQPLEVFDNNPAPPALVGCFHADRLYLVPRDQSETICWSKRHLVESFPSSWFARIGERAGDEIRAMASTSIGLLVFTRRETYLISRGTEDDPTPELISSEAGCVSPATIAQSDRALIWLSGRGVEGFVDGGIQLIAAPIRNIFDDFSLEDMRTAKAAVWKRRNQYWIVIGTHLLMFDMDRGQWSNGYMGCSWIGSMPLTVDGHEDLCSGWWAYLLKQSALSRNDGLAYTGGTTLTAEEDIPAASWYLDGTEIYSCTIQGFIDTIDLPNYFFISFGDHIYMNPDHLVPVCIDRKNLFVGNTYYLAENLPVPVGEVDFNIYRYVPCFYQSNPISVEGIETYKRVKASRFHWDPESHDFPQVRVNVLPEGTAPSTGVSFIRDIFNRESLTTDLTWRYLCRAWKVTWSHWQNHWPAHSHIEWLYDLRRKV